MGYCKENYLEYGKCLLQSSNPRVCVGDECDYWQSEKIPHMCSHCGKYCYSYSWLNGNGQVICDDCDYWQSEKISETCARYRNCAHCGQVFDLEKQGIWTPAKGVFCSQYCRDMNMGEEMLELKMENENLNQNRCASPFRSDDEICAATGLDSLNDKENCEKCGHKFQHGSHLIHEEDAMFEVCDSCYFGHQPKPEISRAEQLAEEHWVYVEKTIQHAGGYWDDEDFEHLDEIEYHYITAFEHGYKHGVEDAIKTAKEGK